MFDVVTKIWEEEVGSADFSCGLSNNHFTANYWSACNFHQLESLFLCFYSTYYVLIVTFSCLQPTSPNWPSCLPKTIPSKNLEFRKQLYLEAFTSKLFLRYHLSPPCALAYWIIDFIRSQSFHISWETTGESVHLWKHFLSPLKFLLIAPSVVSTAMVNSTTQQTVTTFRANRVEA